MEHKENEKYSKDLRFAFVSMLFALTIGNIVTQFTQLLTIPTYYPAYFHLLLAVFVVVTSWVGWARSQAPGNVQPIQAVFSWDFIVLLVDIFLVLCYFTIVKGAEMPQSGTHVTASADNETFWMIIIFAGYLFWDFLTKVVIKSQSNLSFWKRLSTPYFIIKGLMVTGGCLASIIIIRCIFWNISSDRGVILVDILLIAIVFIYRALKQFINANLVWSKHVKSLK
jgi:hypothetical protein